MNQDANEVQRGEPVRAATFEFLSQRNGGHSISVEQFCQQHPDLMPQLERALRRGLQHLQQAQAAERGTSGGTAEREAASAGDQARWPRVRGYQIQAEISGGGQGTVFRAVQETTGRTVALKVIPHASRGSVERFEREVKALATVDHPGVVGILDRGRTADGAFFLVMDFIEGCQLDQWVEGLKGPPAGQRQVVEAFAQVAEAIEAAHAKGIVHRDLKPANVRISTDGRPCIVDFGLARLTGAAGLQVKQLTVTGNIVGSVPWASPEQASGARDVTPATDVYSVGVMLYCALLGRFPYSVDGPLHHTTRHICEVHPIPPQRISRPPFGRVDDSLAAIVMKCLSKLPAARYSTGGVLAADLRRLLAGQRVEAAIPRRRRRRLLIPITASCAAAIVATLVAAARHQEVPLTIDLPHSTNSVGMQFVHLPTGRFTMGSDPVEAGRRDDEQRHKVRIENPFAIALTEVTVGQYRRVMGSLPPFVPRTSPEELPVDLVSLDEAQAFCVKLSAMEHKRYRLPSEGEWEFACRAGTQWTFSNTFDLSQIAWFEGNSGGKLHAVGTRKPNMWGIYDMEGNVSEWVTDGYVPFYNASERSSVANPPNGVFVVRGGSAFDGANDCRCAARRAVPRALGEKGKGFRVVEEIQ